MNPATFSPTPDDPNSPSSAPQRLPETAEALVCVHCGGCIASGDWFFPAGRCAFGGVVTGPSVVLYSDVLEPAGEHPECASAARQRRTP